MRGRRTEEVNGQRAQDPPQDIGHVAQAPDPLLELSGSMLSSGSQACGSLSISSDTVKSRRSRTSSNASSRRTAEEIGFSGSPTTALHKKPEPHLKLSVPDNLEEKWKQKVWRAVSGESSPVNTAKVSPTLAASSTSPRQPQEVPRESWLSDAFAIPVDDAVIDDSQMSACSTCFGGLFCSQQPCQLRSSCCRGVSGGSAAPEHPKQEHQSSSKDALSRSPSSASAVLGPSAPATDTGSPKWLRSTELPVRVRAL